MRTKPPYQRSCCPPASWLFIAPAPRLALQAQVNRAEHSENERRLKEGKLREEESARRAEVYRLRDRQLDIERSKVIALEAELAQIKPDDESLQLQKLVYLYQMKASASLFVASSSTVLSAVCATALMFGVPAIPSFVFVCIEAAALRQFAVTPFDQAQIKVMAAPLHLVKSWLSHVRQVFEQPRNQTIAATTTLVAVAVFAIWQFQKHFTTINRGAIPVAAATALAIRSSGKLRLSAFSMLVTVATSAAIALALSPAMILLACIGIVWSHLAPPATGLELIFEGADSLSLTAEKQKDSHLEKQLAAKAQQREGIERLMQSIKNQANDELNKIEDEFKTRSDKLAEETARELKRCREEVIHIADGLKQRSIEHAKSLKHSLPKHWTVDWKSREKTQKYAVLPVDGALLASLQAVFDVDHPEDLGRGRDVPNGPWKGGDCSNKQLKLAAAWRVENPSLFNSYSAAVDVVASDVAKLKSMNCTKPCCRTPLHDKLRAFRRKAQEDMWRADLHETFLLHGTKPETVLSLLANGLNERFCKGKFGHGVYLAEDPAKNDQYTTVDSAYQGPSASASLSDLHETLYSAHYKHPGDAYYVVLCRVVLGHYIATQDGITDELTGKSVWAVEERELAVVPDSSPPIHHHALVVQSKRHLVANGATVSPSIGLNRHREFLQFNAQRTYPAYLLAYHRLKNGKKY